MIHAICNFLLFHGANSQSIFHLIQINVWNNHFACWYVRQNNAFRNGWHPLTVNAGLMVLCSDEYFHAFLFHVCHFLIIWMCARYQCAYYLWVPINCCWYAAHHINIFFVTIYACNPPHLFDYILFYLALFNCRIPYMNMYFYHRNVFTIYFPWLLAQFELQNGDMLFCKSI